MDNAKDRLQNESDILSPYEKTSPGFELIQADVDGGGSIGNHFRDAGEGYFEVCLWDIGHWSKAKKQGKSLPDPAGQDPEKKAINAMQQALGTLSEDDRLVRIQIACLTRCYYTYPRNIDIVIDGIATGKVNISEQISCEPPWNPILLPFLRQRDGCQNGHDTDQSHERRALVRAYITLLDGYIAGSSLADLQAVVPDQAPLAATTYARLGSPSPTKLLQVTRLRSALSFWAAPAGALHRDGFGHTNRIDQILAEAVPEKTPENEELTKLIAKLHNGLCHQFFFRRLDHLIAHVGAGKRRELSGTGQGREFVIGTLVNYVHSLGSWLAGRSLDQAAEIWPPADQTLRVIYAQLGAPSARKRWLAACLWKMLQERQAWAGRGALDKAPERFRLPATAFAI